MFNQLKEQFIARPDESKNQILYKWPDRNIRMLSQLMVEPDEVAVFVKNGVVVGTLAGGKHTLSGADIPFLGGLIDLATGGNFLISELYFISIREFIDLPFGGMIDNVLDPSTNLAIGLRTYGSYALKVTDFNNLILNLVGTQNLVSNEQITDWTREQLMKSLRTVISNHITNDKWEILGIASKTEVLQTEVLGNVVQFLTNYGITLTNIGNFTVTINPKDEETLKNLRRDMAYTQNPNLSDTALKLGAAQGLSEGANAGLAGAGIAAGLGFGMMNQITNQQNQSQIECTNCHTQNPTNAKFCTNCGNKLG